MATPEGPSLVSDAAPGTDPDDGNPYAAPLAAVGVVPREFWTRKRGYIVVTVLFSAFAVSGLVSGALVFVGLIPRADRDSGRAEGRMWMAFGVVFAAPVPLMAAAVLARRGPTLRACREGVEIRLLGRSSVDCVPSAPSPVRLAWRLVSGRDARFPKHRIPWAGLVSIGVMKKALWRALVVHFTPETGGEVCYVWIAQRELGTPAPQAAEALLAFARDEQARALLPSWDNEV